ncbi:hypothetical protein BGZ57DRAFT_920806 [Hyaloscypha finlandica]|nr:hypothetical protein BGZ57DRAFT_920806 [Hyaloscypha finlandica]
MITGPHYAITQAVVQVRDPIVLLGDNDSTASEAEVDDGGPCAESVAVDEGLLDSPETLVFTVG